MNIIKYLGLIRKKLTKEMKFNLKTDSSIKKGKHLFQELLMNNNRIIFRSIKRKFIQAEKILTSKYKGSKSYSIKALVL